MTYFYSLASSSSGNCALYAAGDRKILIDAGTNTKYIRESLATIGLGIGDLTDILITHSHSDHISALPVLTKHCGAVIHCSEGTRNSILSSCNHDKIEVFGANEAVFIGETCVGTFETPHDCVGSCGFTFENENGKFAYCTDLGHVTPDIFNRLSGAKTAFLESNHDVYMLKTGEYPYYLKARILSDTGHISNEVSAQTIARLTQTGLKKVVLSHLSQHNNTPSRALAETAEALAEIGAQGAIDVSAAPYKRVGSQIAL